MIIHYNIKTLEEAEFSAKRTSLDWPGMYVTLFNCFGLEVCMHDRLHVFAPSDSFGDYYWLNGKKKRFTEKQKIADSMATPALS